MIKIELPFPKSSLSPNQKNGKSWQSTYQDKKDAKLMAELLTRGAEGYKDFKAKPEMSMTVTFLMPDKRGRDADNMIACIKPHIDGISKALGIDDKILWPVVIKREYQSKGGLIIQIE